MGSGLGAFPALGFDPAPGDPEAAAALSERLAVAVASLHESCELVSTPETGEGADWRSSVAEELRTHLAEDLPKALTNAHGSLAKAQSALASWATQLTEFQFAAASLEAQATEAKARLDETESDYRQAQKNPDLGLLASLGVSLSLEQIQAAGDARAQLLRCEARLQEYRALLETTNRQAKELLREHQQAAGEVAEQLRSAPTEIAPVEPGSLGRALSWLHGHARAVGETVNAVSGMTGLLAVVPPLSIVCEPLTVACSAGSSEPAERAGEIVAKDEAGLWHDAATVTASIRKAVDAGASVGAKTGS